MMEEMEIFALYLRRRKMRMTAVRRAIFDFAAHADSPFDEVAIRHSIQIKNTAVNRSSVYRNLLLLKDAGLIEPCAAKRNGKTVFVSRSRRGRTYDIMCAGGLSRNIFSGKLEEAVLELCEQYRLDPDSVMVRIDARFRRESYESA